MSVPQVSCGICKKESDQPLVCRGCISLWKELFGKKSNKSSAEASAQKTKEFFCSAKDGLPFNCLAYTYRL